MKLLCLLLTAYLFVLSCLPCAGCDHDHDPAKPEAATAFFPEKTTAHHAVADACNPFCACCCHSGFTVTARVFVETDVLPALNIPVRFPELASHSTQRTGRVWQPPKV